MKHIIKYFIYAIAVTFLFTACNKDLIDPLTGKYPPPEEVTLTSVDAKNVVKQENGTRLISLQLSAANGSFTVDFVVNTSFLRENAYTLASVASARNGNYTAAQYSGNNVIAGVIDVKLSDESNYTISGVLQLGNHKFVKIFFAGDIIFDPDPPEYVYTLAVQKPYAWTADGSNFTPVAGSQLNIIEVYADGALVAHFEIVTAENPTSLSGTYPVSGAIRDADGAVVQGMYMDLSAIVPGLIIKGGSYLAEDDNALYLFGGNLTIVDNSGILTFTSSNFSILDVTSGFEPAPLPGVQSINYPEATKGGSGGYNGTELTKLLGFSNMDLSLFGGSGYNVTVKLATDGVSATDNGVGGLDFAGSGNYVSIDFRRDAATLVAGTYNIVPDASAQVGDAIAGYPALFGGGNWGSVWGTVTGGAGSDVQINGGVVTVSVNGDIYTIEMEVVTENGTIKARYIGKLSNDTEPEPTETVLTKLLSYSNMDLSLFGGSGYNVTVKLATDGVSATDNGVGGLDFAGSGNYLSVDFRRDAATLVAGTYNIVPDASAQVGDAIAGYPALFGGGNWGSVWGTVTNGAGSDVKITGGVITVSVAGDIYTISIEATTEDGKIKARYIGKLSNDTEPEPTETVLTKLLSYSNMDLSLFGGSGYNVTVKLATDGVSATDNGMGGLNFAGNGNYLSVDFRRDAATLIAGTYNIVPDASAHVGDAIAGYPAMFGGGNWGSVWGTVTGGAGSDVQINGGVITVSVAGGIYTISIEATTEDGKIKAKYTGKISDDTEPEPTEIALTELISFSNMDLSLFGGSGYNVTVKLATDEVSATDNGMGGLNFAGSGNYLSVDFRRDAATLVAGTYNIVPDASAHVGDAIAGYPAMFGGGNWGSVWGTVTGGVGSDVQITGGVITVSVAGDIYTISIEVTTESGDIKAKYTGNVE